MADPYPARRGKQRWLRICNNAERLSGNRQLCEAEKYPGRYGIAGHAIDVVKNNGQLAFREPAYAMVVIGRGASDCNPRLLPSAEYRGSSFLQPAAVLQIQNRYSSCGVLPKPFYGPRRFPQIR